MQAGADEHIQQLEKAGCLAPVDISDIVENRSNGRKRGYGGSKTAATREWSYSPANYERLGRSVDAEALLRREFERAPSVDFYKRMKVMLGRGEAVQDRAMAVLKTQLAKPASRSSPRRTFLPDVVIRLLVDEKLLGDAREVAAKHEVRARERMRLTSGLSPEQQRDVLHAFLDRHYEGRLDEKVPSLGGLTPRAAATTEAGRRKLIEWLKYLENNTERHDPADPARAYDFLWLWKELGIEALRR